MHFIRLRPGARVVLPCAYPELSFWLSLVAPSELDPIVDDCADGPSPGFGTQGPSTALRFGRDDKVLGLGRNERFTKPAFNRLAHFSQASFEEMIGPFNDYQLLRFR